MSYCTYKKPLTFFLVISISFTCLFVARAEDSAPKQKSLQLTLDEAIDIAMKNNHHAKESLASLPVAEANLIIARYFPNPIIGINSEIVKGGSTHPIQLGQSLELGRKRHYRIQIAREQISKAELEAAKTLWEIHTQTHIKYALLAINNDLFSLAKERLKFYNSLVDIAKKQYEVGNIARIELDRANLQLLSAENNHDDFEGNLKKAKIDFNHILGNESDKEIDVKNVDELKPHIMIQEYIPIKNILEKALNKRLELAILEKDFGITRAQLKKAEWDRLPNLYVEGGPAKPSYQDNIWGPYVGASLELPVFNRKQGEIAQAKANLNYLEKQKETIEHDIKINVANAIKDLEVREKQVYRFQEKLLNQSTNVLELIKEGYQNGKLSLTDVLNAEEKDRELKESYLKSLFEYQTALATLEYSVGVPLYGLTE